MKSRRNTFAITVSPDSTQPLPRCVTLLGLRHLSCGDDAAHELATDDDCGANLTLFFASLDEKQYYTLSVKIDASG